MKATEFRIGNLIYNTIGEVDTVNLDALKYLINYPNTLCQAKPIYLTEEWLLKFGFKAKKKLSGHFGFYKDGWYLIPEEDVFELIAAGSSLIIGKIKYVHQLQNLYFALTGEELIIK